MTSRPYKLLLTVALSIVGLAFATVNTPVDELIKEAQNAGDRQPELYSKVVRQEVDAARDNYNSGNAPAAESALNAAVTYSDKLLESARQHRKHLKATELGLRETTRRLREVERELEFEQRPPAAAAREHLEQVDSELLKLELLAPKEQK